MLFDFIFLAMLPRSNTFSADLFYFGRQCLLKKCCFLRLLKCFTRQCCSYNVMGVTSFILSREFFVTPFDLKDMQCCL